MNNNDNPNFNLNLVNPLDSGGQPTTEPLAPSAAVPDTQPVESLSTEPPTTPSTGVAGTEAISTDAPLTAPPTVAEEKKEEIPTYSPPTKAPLQMGDTRYNPVTGEEMSVTGQQEEKKEEVKEEIPKKTPEEEKKANSKANSIMLIIFFIALIAFVIFLPDIQVLISEYRSGPQKVEEITTGKLVCTLESSTVNLDREITRVFEYNEMKLQSAKFTTVVRGDATLDEDTLDEMNAQCVQIKENVEGLEGVSVSCTYEEGKLTEKETFDYITYNLDEVSAAYVEAGGSVLEFEYEANIDDVMTNMRQGGFTCNKEK